MQWMWCTVIQHHVYFFPPHIAHPILLQLKRGQKESKTQGVFWPRPPLWWHGWSVYRKHCMLLLLAVCILKVMHVMHDEGEKDITSHQKCSESSLKPLRSSLKSVMLRATWVQVEDSSHHLCLWLAVHLSQHSPPFCYLQFVLSNSHR